MWIHNIHGVAVLIVKLETVQHIEIKLVNTFICCNTQRGKCIEGIII